MSTVAESPPPDAGPAGATRLASIDVYRGVTMLALALTAARGGWQEPIVEAHPAVRGLVDQFEHATWRGLTLWDMIQPSFMFLVGVSLPFSLASRRRRGASDASLWAHAVLRAVALVLLGVFLRSLHRNQTYWTLEDVVSQIGLGYLPLFWLAMLPRCAAPVAGAVLLAATWLVYAFWPGDADPSVAVEHFRGSWSVWNQSVGPGIALDRWLLNLFPREAPFTHNGGGYYTLNFLPSLATMSMGLVAGRMLRGERQPGAEAAKLAVCGAALAATGVALDACGLCPVVKKTWTPSFALLSGGVCTMLLAAFYAVVDVAGIRRWAWAAAVVGRNPLAVYVMTYTVADWTLTNLLRHLGEGPFLLLGAPYALLLENVTVGLILFAVALGMDRKNLYLRL